MCCPLGRIFTDRRGNYVYIDPDSGTTSVHAVNRSKTEKPSQMVPWVLGTWTSTEDQTNLVTFQEDGTCVLRGAEGLWTLDYDSYNPEWNNWISLLVKVGTQEYRVQVNATGTVIYMGISLSDGVEVVGSTSVTKDIG